MLVEESEVGGGDHHDDDDNDDDQGGGGGGGGGSGIGGGAGVKRSMNLVLAWEQIVVYKSNASALKIKQVHIDNAVTYLSVLLTSMVAIKTYLLAQDETHMVSKVGRCRLTLSNPRWKRLELIA
jgi:hypothetical protein